MSERLEHYYNREEKTRKIIIDYRLPDIDEFYAANYDTVLTPTVRNRMRSKFLMMISHLMITESFEFKMPYTLGSIYVRANKLNYRVKDGKIVNTKNMVNWVATKKLWAEIYPDLTREELKAIKNKKKVLYTNDHSNGYIMGFYWHKFNSRVKNKNKYSFRAVKGRQDSSYYDGEGVLYYGKRGLSKWIKSYDRTNEYVTGRVRNNEL